MAVLVVPVPVSILSGRQEFGPVVVPDALRRLTVRLKRFTTLTPTFWTDPATTVSGELFISYDDGLTYVSLCGMTSQGGLSSDHDGSEGTETTFSYTMPDKPARRVKLCVRVTNGPLVSQMTMEAT